MGWGCNNEKELKEIIKLEEQRLAVEEQSLAVLKQILAKVEIIASPPPPKPATQIGILEGKPKP